MDPHKTNVELALEPLKSAIVDARYLFVNEGAIESIRRATEPQGPQNASRKKTRKRRKKTTKKS